MIDILCRTTSQQRQEIALSYKTQYGRDLLKNIQDEVSGNFQQLFEALLKTPAQLEAHDLKRALSGLGTTEATLIDIICTKSKQEMLELRYAYKQLYGRDMESEVTGDTSGYFKRFLVSLMTANRSESGPDTQRASQLARELYEAGEKRLGTNEMVFNRIFAAESLLQLRIVCDEYYRMTGHDIEKAIKSEMSGDVENAFLAVARTAQNPARYWAKRLHDTMAVAGTHDHSLIRILVLRSEIDLMDIKLEFQKLYNKSLESYIRSDCSGDYKRGLLCLTGDTNWR